MKRLLEETKRQLVQPLGEARRKLLLLMNSSYVILTVVFLILEKSSTGSFVPHTGLLGVYIPAILLNCLSASYNYLLLWHDSSETVPVYVAWMQSRKERLDVITGWVSLGPMMVMSFLNMMGVGNPSSDSILTDFALGQSLIIGAIMIVGRAGTLAWFLIVLGVLLFQTDRIGWDYQYHYMLPKEAKHYQQALEKREEWALARSAELDRAGLQGPKVARYFNTWLVFIIVSFFAAYFFSGVSVDMLKRIPDVMRNLERAIQGSTKRDVEYLAKVHDMQRDQTAYAMRILRYNDMLALIQKELRNIPLKERREFPAIVTVVRLVEQLLESEKGWEAFEQKFNESNSNFFHQIAERHPDLNQKELRLLALVKSNVPREDIARLLGIKRESVKQMIYRVKAKLGVTEERPLEEYLQQLTTGQEWEE